MGSESYRLAVGFLLCRQKNNMKMIKETKCTCSACGNIWFYGKEEKVNLSSAQTANCGKTAMCCSGCLPALLIPHKEEIDLNKCPKCGSRAIKKEKIIHNV